MRGAVDANQTDGIAWCPPPVYSQIAAKQPNPVLFIRLDANFPAAEPDIAGFSLWCRPLPAAKIPNRLDLLLSPKSSSISPSSLSQTIFEFKVAETYFKYDPLKAVEVSLTDHSSLSYELEFELIRCALLGVSAVNRSFASVTIQDKIFTFFLTHNQISSSGAFPIITSETQIKILPNTTRPIAAHVNRPTKIKDPQNSLDRAFNRLFEVVCYPMLYKRLMLELGLDIPRGVLLSGPPGVGKTRLVQRIAHASHVPLIVVHGPELLASDLGASEKNMSQIFERANNEANKSASHTCLIFIDEIDSIAVKRSETEGAGVRLVAQLLTLLDGVKKNFQNVTDTVPTSIIVIGATNRPNSIDPAFRRPGRFDVEIALEPPTTDERLDLLSQLTKPFQIQRQDLLDIARQTAGFVAADLTALLRESFSIALSHDLNKIELCHINQALSNIRPSLTRELHITTDPEITLDSIYGYDDVKKKIRQAIEWPILHMSAFKRLGVLPPRGILLFGPPGCSKTTFAKAIANMTGVNFYSLSGASVLSCYLGESERQVRMVFQNARLTRPSVVFIDELDALVGKRESSNSLYPSDASTRILTTFLNEMDGIESAEGVFVLAATNRLHSIDSALLRPGRFDLLLEIPLPELASRIKILHAFCASTPIAPAVSIDELASKTAGFSGADLKKLVQEAALCALEQGRNIVERKDFNVALQHL